MEIPPPKMARPPGGAGEGRYPVLIAATAGGTAVAIVEYSGAGALCIRLYPKRLRLPLPTKRIRPTPGGVTAVKIPCCGEPIIVWVGSVTERIIRSGWPMVLSICAKTSSGIAAPPEVPPISRAPRPTAPAAALPTFCRTPAA